MLTFVIFGALVLLIFLGTPVAVSMGITSIAVFEAMGERGLLAMLGQRMYSGTTGFTLLAIPFFILAGNLMNTGGITNRIFRFARAGVGHIWGGLGQVNIVASMIFSGMSGAAVADAAGLGMIELKAMKDQGYDDAFSAAVTAASSTIGPVVPPSIPFVIYASLTGVSVIKLFLAGFVPGIMMGLAMMVAVYFISRKRKYPREERADFKERTSSFADALLPLGTPVLLIGGILSGWFTPTEAAVVACLYALILGLFVYREIKFKDISGIVWETVKQSVKVLFIISAANFFSWLMVRQRIPEMLINFLTNMSSNPNVIMLLMIFILLILGCFIEGVAVFVIAVPIFMPIVYEYGIDPVLFGVVMTLCSMIGLITPPVGMSLYAVSSISGVKIGPLSRELLPYILGIFLVLLIIAYAPGLTLWLPRMVG
jgi:C4-dicarboxylate transporter DctM subunit